MSDFIQANTDLVTTAATVVGIILVAFVTSQLVRRSIKKALRSLSQGTVKERLGARKPAMLHETGELSIRSEQRVEALATVLRSAASVVIWTIAAFLVLGQFGVDLGPLIAGAGIVGVALGFGSQSLVKDFISGIFILIEDQFGVGDLVDLGEATGTVTAVSLRTTRLRAIDGTVWHVPNGEIRRVGNKSQHWSRALLDIQVAYGTDIPAARAVIKQVADALWHEWPDTIIEEPEVWGVEDLGPNAIDIRMALKTKPSEQFEVGRELRERIKAAFEREGIEIPNQNMVMADAAAA
ncbi:MAG TPA: mechanosensitive ion channel family protein [Thermoleophilaceae bacterium]|nr:mechanosensitive ion channel family protein [Thermoleophilaceae bacterium]